MVMKDLCEVHVMVSDLTHKHGIEIGLQLYNLLSARLPGRRTLKLCLVVCAALAVTSEPKTAGDAILNRCHFYESG